MTRRSIECPTCKGTKFLAGTASGEGFNALTSEDCCGCAGHGFVTPERYEKILAGERMRADRIARGVGVQAEAKALGITPSKLARIERGEAA